MGKKSSPKNRRAEHGDIVKMNSAISEFEAAFDELIKTHLTDVDQAEINEHFGDITMWEHIKLIKWSVKEEKE